MEFPRTRETGLEAKKVGRFLLVYGLLGVLAGLAAVCFVWMLETGGAILLESYTGLNPSGHYPISSEAALSWPQGAEWFILLIPTLGGASIGHPLFSRGA
jgi:hypothetical protein